MRIRMLVLVFALAACGRQPAQEKRAEAPPAAAPMQQAAMVSLPKDPASVKRLEAMGYTVHDDHLHAPGVSSCPKMGDDPIM